MLLDRLIGFFTSLKLTVVCLVLGMVLVFIGTLAQVDLGLYRAQEQIFQSFVVFWGPKGAGWKLPVFPGGYLIGGLLLINLVSAHYKRFGFRKDKLGIIITHLGIILMLIGQIGTDLLSRESSLHLRVGEARNYSEADRRMELALIDVTDSKSDSVFAIPDSRLATERQIRDAALPFAVTVLKFLPHSSLSSTAKPGFDKVPATAGFGPQLWYRAEPKVTKMDARDMPTAIVELHTPQGQSLGTWLISSYLDQPQTVTVGGRTYQIDLRLRRYYQGFSLRLLEFRHDVYKGTDIPKNFSSLVRVQNPRTGEDRQVKIYMNNPLRYGGLTFYQASFDADNQGSVLQVVRNPGWLTPYLACILVGAGLLIQFLSHLIPFLQRRLKS
jgi:hypothetical protein